MPAPTLRPAVPTAFHDDGALDLDGQAALCAVYAAAGSSAVLTLATGGGEPETLDDDERDRVVRACRAGAGGLPLLVGIGSPDAGVVRRAVRAGVCGADAVVVTLPQVGTRAAELLGEVAAVGPPLLLHQPALPGAEPDTAATLALGADLGVDSLIVEAAPSTDGITAAVAVGWRAFGGLAGLFLPEELEAGASGTTAALAVPEGLVEMLHASGGAADLEAFLHLLAYLRLEVESPGLRVRKEAWRQRGVLRSGRTRRGAPLSASTKRTVTRRLRVLGVGLPDAYPDD